MWQLVVPHTGWCLPHCVELFVRRGVLVCQERCPCLSGEVSLSVRRGVLVCQGRCPCLSGEVSLSVRRGVLVCQERCPCPSGEVSLSVRRGVLVCQERCPCLSGEVSLSVRRGVLVCPFMCCRMRPLPQRGQWHCTPLARWWSTLGEEGRGSAFFICSHFHYFIHLIPISVSILIPTPTLDVLWSPTGSTPLCWTHFSTSSSRRQPLTRERRWGHN